MTLDEKLDKLGWEALDTLSTHGLWHETLLPLLSAACALQRAEDAAVCRERDFYWEQRGQVQRAGAAKACAAAIAAGGERKP